MQTLDEQTMMPQSAAMVLEPNTPFVESTLFFVIVAGALVICLLLGLIACVVRSKRRKEPELADAHTPDFESARDSELDSVHSSHYGNMSSVASSDQANYIELPKKAISASSEYSNVFGGGSASSGYGSVASNDEYGRGDLEM